MFNITTSFESANKHRHMRVLSLLLVVSMLISLTAVFTSSASAAYSEIRVNISTSPVTRNGDYEMPAAAPVIYANETYYINLAATSDFKLDRYEVYCKESPNSAYQLFIEYDPAGFFRWHNQSVYFKRGGNCYLKFVVVTTDGQEMSTEGTIYVEEPRANTSTFSPVWPCNANYISTLYRYWNSGSPSSHRVRTNKYNAIDIFGSKGDAIYAIESGTVVDKGYQRKGFGYYVVIEHSNGLYSLYGHLKSSAAVSKGDTVSSMQVIGYMGSTGDSTNNHLHFELYDPKDASVVINPWTSYYQGNVNVTIGGNSYKANNKYRDSDTYAAAWCDWLNTYCTMNSNGDYVFKK